MPIYFDPLQAVNAFSAGSQVGGGIRKNQTQSKLAPMIAAGDYKGANAFAASRGDLEMMDYLRPMAKEAEDAAYSKQLGGMLASGDTKGAMASAFGAGKLDQGMAIREYGRALKAEEITDYRTGLEFLDSNADDVMKNFTPDQRKAEYIRRVAASPFGQDANIMTALERAGADGIITDDEVIGFRRELMTAGERMAQQNWQTSFDYGVGQDEQAQSNWERQFQADEDAREAAAANSGSSELGLSPIYGRDKNGNRVVFQPSKSGGLVQAQVPEGVTLEDDFYKSAAKTQGTELAKQQLYQTTAGQAVLAAEDDMTRLASQIDQAIEQSSGWNTGTLGQFNPFAGDINGTLKTIRGSSAFTNLVALKAQGGTLGALSDAELGLLESKIANVERSQSQDQLDANLEILKMTLQQSTQRLKAAYEQEYSSGRFQGLPQVGQGTVLKTGPSGQPVPPGFE